MPGRFSKCNSTASCVLHNFDGGEGGARPRAGLTEYKGALYGTTIFGGTKGFGTVFEVTP